MPLARNLYSKSTYMLCKAAVCAVTSVDPERVSCSVHAAQEQPLHMPNVEEDGYNLSKELTRQLRRKRPGTLL